MDLKQQLKEGDTHSLILIVKGTPKNRNFIEVNPPVKLLVGRK